MKFQPAKHDVRMLTGTVRLLGASDSDQLWRVSLVRVMANVHT